MTTELHKKLQEINIDVYNDEPSNINGAFVVSKKENKKNGFYGRVSQYDNKVVISYRGSDEAKDWTHSNANMGARQMPSQIQDARELYNEVKKDYPKGTEIIVTGHSLGGSLAQIVAAENEKDGVKAVTLNAYGTKDIINSDKPYPNIVNYGNIEDGIFHMNIDKQVGEVFYTDNRQNPKGIDGYVGINPEEFIKNAHRIQDMGDLSNAQKYYGSFPYVTNKIKAGIEYNDILGDIDTKYTDPNRVITPQEIGSISDEDFIDNEKFINALLQKGNIMDESEAQAQVQSGGLIWVDDYEREDGTEVKGYFRRR